MNSSASPSDLSPAPLGSAANASRRRSTLSLRWRIVLGVSAVALLTTILVGGAAVLITRNQLLHNVDEDLRELAGRVHADQDTVATLAPLAGNPGRSVDTQHRDADVPFDDSDGRPGRAPAGRHDAFGDTSNIGFRYFDERRTTLLTNINSSATATAADLEAGQKSRRAGGVPILRTAGSDEDRYRVLVMADSVTMTDDSKQDVYFQLVRPLGDTLDATRTLTLVVTGVGIVALLAAFGVSWLVGSALIGPVNRLAVAARTVADTDDLTVSVPEEGGTELENVARSFNEMIVTLRTSRDQQSRLIADAGHELRTPLTSLKTNIEVLGMADALSADDRTALLSDVSEQIDEMASLVGDLTELARGGPGATDERIDVSLDLIAASALKRAQRRAPGMVWKIDLRPALVSANPQLLERAVMNLCDNAAKWNPAGGTIAVEMDDAVGIAGGVRLSVSDEGPGIAPEYRKSVFERFWRTPDARSMPGSGLGLSIVAQVITDMGGTVEVKESAAGGARVEIELPVAV